MAELQQNAYYYANNLSPLGQTTKLQQLTTGPYVPQKSISFSKKILLAVWPPARIIYVQFHFPNSWILTLQQWCRTTMMKMVIPPTNQLLTHQFCWLITFKLEGSIVIQLRVVVVLVFPPHPHIHPLVSRNVIKWMTKTWGCCRIVHGAKDQKTERNDKKSIGKMRVRAKSLLSLVLPIKKRRGNRKFFLKECHRYVWI